MGAYFNLQAGFQYNTIDVGPQGLLGSVDTSGYRGSGRFSPRNDVYDPNQPQHYNADEDTYWYQGGTLSRDKRFTVQVDPSISLRGNLLGKHEAKIGIQLGHAGRKGATRLLWEGEDSPLPEGEAWPLLAASPLPWAPGSQIPRPMERADMDAVTRDFVRATELALQAGFDLIEVHMAHGYLLASFLSPLTNQRRDEYGGSLENRARFPLAVLRAVRAAWPAERPLSVRISATDWAPGGMAAAEAVATARLLKAAGADIVAVSTGQTIPGARPAYGRLFQTPFAEQIRLEAEIPTIAVGMISSYTDVNSIIAAGRADLVALARAHLYDPYWTRHAAAEQEYELAWPQQYRSVARFRPRLK